MYEREVLHPQRVENLPDIEKWIIFLKYSNDKEKRDLLNCIMGSSEGIKEAGEILMTISDDEREWAIQEMRYKAEVDREAFRIADHEKAVSEGRAEGLKQGRVEGLELGRTEGLEQGRTEGLLKSARGMKAENIPLETIVKITGLTPDQVASL